MNDVIPHEIARYAQALGPERVQIIREMDERADRDGFPTVGPAVGGWLTLLARTVDAERIFEFGSGFGYSAFWFAKALSPDGLVVLTEIDEDELADAREYLARAGFDDRATFEHGDAIETIDRYDGPFDVVLIDNEKDRYAEAFEAVRSKIPPGGLVLADNAMTAGIIDFDALLEHAEGGNPEMDEYTAGIAEYLDRVRADPDFETVLLPLGEGVAVSRRLP